MPLHQDSDSKEVKTIQELLKTKPASSSEIAKPLDVSKVTALKTVEMMIATKSIIKIGNGPGTQYQLQ